MSTALEMGASVLDFSTYADSRAARQENGGNIVRALLTAIDHLEHCFAFHDRLGRVQHASNSFVAELASADDADGVRAQISQFAQAVAAMAFAARVGAVAQQMETRAITGARGPYRLKGTYIGWDLFGTGPCVLISMVPPPHDLCTVDQLGNRFLLTRAQSRVARLLASGLRNAEIAERLFLSEHTVRHHIEQIRLKVGGHTRSAIAARLRGQA